MTIKYLCYIGWLAGPPTALTYNLQHGCGGCVRVYTRGENAARAIYCQPIRQLYCQRCQPNYKLPAAAAAAVVWQTHVWSNDAACVVARGGLLTGRLDIALLRRRPLILQCGCGQVAYRTTTWVVQWSIVLRVVGVCGQRVAVNGNMPSVTDHQTGRPQVVDDVSMDRSVL